MKAGLRRVDSLEQVPAAAWDALGGRGEPFLSHAFLRLLETTGCVGGRTGWRPAHLLLESAQGTLEAALPAYLKDHSWGEFVFDFGWAQAHARHGLRYYPKLLCAVPFTPATGPRLLVRAQGTTSRGALVSALEDHVREQGLSSAHALFVDEADRAAFEAAGWLLRRDCQFHWYNRGYRDYEDYLATFTAEKRKKTRRERRRAPEAGIAFRTLHGDELTPTQLDVVHDLHRITFLEHGHEPYLNRAFFREVGPLLGRRMMVKLAERAGEPVAAAVFFRSDRVLYGRYWGARADCHSLHFEACYHQGIEYCIEHGLQHFEPGTQGEHKVSRGFEPTLTWSAHFIADERFREAIADYLEREAPAVEEYAAEIDRHTPFRRP